jgi:DNA-binding beta-propeller fold protein YncE
MQSARSARYRGLMPIVAAVALVASAVMATVVSVAATAAAAPRADVAWVVNFNANEIVPLDTATPHVGRALASVQDPYASAITPDGRRLEYVDADHHRNEQGGHSYPGRGLPLRAGHHPDGKTAYVTEFNGNTVVPVNLTTNTALARVTVGTTASEPIAVSITPDQEPVAAFTVKPKVSGSPTTFNASASKGLTNQITSYSWRFGDGRARTTSRPTVTHVYAARRSYRVTLTVADADGTSTTRVFTGQTVSRNGGRSAVARHLVRIPRRP